MKKKLTLTVEDELIKKGKLFCIENNTSISEIVETVLFNLDKIVIKNSNGDHNFYDLYLSERITGL